MTMEIQPGTDLYQSMTIVIPSGGESSRVRFELRYLPETDKWYVSLFDAQSGDSLILHVPLVASYGDPLNNLFEPYGYKHLGMLYCLPRTDNPSTQDPAVDSLSEFAIVWSDGNADE